MQNKNSFSIGLLLLISFSAKAQQPITIENIASWESVFEKAKLEN